MSAVQTRLTSEQLLNLIGLHEDPKQVPTKHTWLLWLQSFKSRESFPPPSPPPSESPVSFRSQTTPRAHSLHPHEPHSLCELRPLTSRNYIISHSLWASGSVFAGGSKRSHSGLQF